MGTILSFVDVGNTLRSRSESVQHQRPVRCRSGIATCRDGNQFDRVPTGGKGMRQVSYMTLLPTPTRRVKLSEHQNAHRASNATALRRTGRLRHGDASVAPLAAARPMGAGRQQDYALEGEQQGAREQDIGRLTDVSVEDRAGELADETAGQSRRSRAQIVLGCVGLILVATGVLLATVTARKEWTPPLELSVTHEHDGQSVATVNWGSTGPIAAQLDIVAEGKVLWSSPLDRSGAVQSVILPRGLLTPDSLLIVASGGHTLRGVDA